MDKIALIVASEKMIPFIQDTIPEDIISDQVVVMTIDVMNIKTEYRKLCAQGYAVILARGGTYTELVSVADSAVVMEMLVRTSDVLLAIRNLRESYPGKVYVVLHEKVALDFEKTLSLYNFNIEVFRYTSPAGLKEQIESIPDQNVAVLTSGIASDIVDRKDLSFVQIQLQKEAIRENVERAKSHIYQTRRDKERVNLLESIYSNVNEGIIVFDKNQIIQDSNLKAAELLHTSRDQVTGNNIKKFLTEIPKRYTIDESTFSPCTFLQPADNTMLSITISPFIYYESEERFLVTLQDVTRIQETERKIRQKLAQKGLTANYQFKDILTTEHSMKQVIDLARKISVQEGSVLIYGENGTGKELFAQSIHNASHRKNGPFVAVNCAALTESLLESELFGYVGGAFTGARREGKAGLFEMAHEGTIFLDEINSMPLNLQAKILRVIEQQEVMRVGSDYVIPLNVRIIAASNQPLRESITSGAFRQDLFFRLNTFEINIPPINQRKKDVVYLFRYYLSLFGQCDIDDIHLDKDFQTLLEEHDWWGNVREIKSTALRYHAFQGDNSTGAILQNQVSTDTIVTDDFRIDLQKLSKTVEQLVINSMIEQNMKKNDIAKALGISRQALYKKLNPPS